jgi:hypothetical protein
MVPPSALRFRPTADMLAALGGAPGGHTPSCAGGSGCGVLWTYDGLALRAVDVRTGISNGTAVEVLEGSVTEGTGAVTAVRTAAASAKTVTTAGAGSSTTRSPLLSTMPGPPPGPR